MAQAISTQNQNIQLTKVFLAAFAAMLVAVPIVTIITASIVQAQFGNIAHAAAVQQSNNAGSAGTSCVVPADEAAKSNAKSGGFWGFKWLPVSQSNSSSTVTNTTTTTTTNTDNSEANTTVDNRWSGNTLGLSFTDNRYSGNTVSNTTTFTHISDNGNTYTDNRNSGNTTNTSNTNVQNNVNVNSGNTIINDNDGVDVL